MNSPLVSVVMAVYNGKPYLSQAIDSILAQTFRDFELIVIDDASTDGSSEILANYRDHRLIILSNEQNIGLTRSLNRGLSIARGCIIARHDADDISDPDRFRQQVTVFDREPSVGLVGTNHYVIDRQNQIIDTVQYPCSNDELQLLLMAQNCFCHGSVMFRKSCIHSVGAYREQFRVTQDYDLWLRIAESYDLSSLPTYLYKFRFHTNAISHNKTNLQISYEHLSRVFAQQRRTCGQEGAIPANVSSAFPPEPQRILDHALTSAYYLYASGDYPNAESALKSAQVILAKHAVNCVSWEEWIFSKACRLAVLHNRVDNGTQFIRWAYQALCLQNRKELCRSTLGHFYADQAFLSHQNSKHKEVFCNARLAITSDGRWLQNRGLLKITVKSLGRLALSAFKGSEHLFL